MSSFKLSWFEWFLCYFDNQKQSQQCQGPLEKEKNHLTSSWISSCWVNPWIVKNGWKKVRFSFFCLQKCYFWHYSCLQRNLQFLMGFNASKKSLFFKICLNLVRKQMRKRPFQNHQIAAKRCVLQSLHWTSSTFEILFWLLSPNFVQFDQ